MKRGREKCVAAALVLITLGCLLYAGKITLGLSQAAAGGPIRPNVFVISVCSLRKDLLSTYGHKGGSVMPALEQFFGQSSVLYERAFNGVPWISIISFIEPYFPLLTAQGYLAASPYWEYAYTRIPLQRTLQTARPEASELNDSEFEKDYKSYAEDVKQQILLPRSAPFALVVHIKYLHYPLIDQFNSDSEWDHFLSQSERDQIAEYSKHPEKYFSKLPMMLMLTGDPKYALAHPEIQRTVKKRDAATLRSLSGLVSNERYLQEWKASPGYAGDLEIVKKAYAGNARYLDQKLLEPMFNLYGNDELKRNTVVVFAGDHGEMHMERDQLTHATSGYDEAVEIPAAVKFPSDWPSGIRVKGQTPIHRIADLTEGVLAGSVHRENLAEKIQSLTDDVIILRDCRNTVRGLRFKNKYKYLVDTASGERQLFDLEQDPDELVNVALSRSETADEMEALYWTHLPQFNWIPPYRCLPW